MKRLLSSKNLKNVLAVEVYLYLYKKKPGKLVFTLKIHAVFFFLVINLLSNMYYLFFFFGIMAIILHVLIQ